MPTDPVPTDKLIYQNCEQMHDKIHLNTCNLTMEWEKWNKMLKIIAYELPFFK